MPTILEKPKLDLANGEAEAAPQVAVNQQIRDNALKAEVLLAGSGAKSDESAREHLEDEVLKHVSTTTYAQRGVIRAVATSETVAPGPIERLQDLSDGWDGRDAQRPSEVLLANAERAWQLIYANFPAAPAHPKVRMGRANFISFSWTQKDPRKELHIWVHDSEQFKGEFHFRSGTDQKDGLIESNDELLSAVELFVSSS